MTRLRSQPLSHWERLSQSTVAVANRKYLTTPLFTCVPHNAWFVHLIHSTQLANIILHLGEVVCLQGIINWSLNVFWWLWSPSSPFNSHFMNGNFVLCKLSRGVWLSLLLCVRANECCLCASMDYHRRHCVPSSQFLLISTSPSRCQHMLSRAMTCFVRNVASIWIIDTLSWSINLV